jgi:hypothetical protein
MTATDKGIETESCSVSIISNDDVDSNDILLMVDKENPEYTHIFEAYATQYEAGRILHIGTISSDSDNLKQFVSGDISTYTFVDKIEKELLQ